MAYLGKRRWLEDLRYAKRWTQNRVAAEAGMSQSMYSRIELGYSKPSERQAAAIAAALGFDVRMFEYEYAENKAFELRSAYHEQG